MKSVTETPKPRRRAEWVLWIGLGLVSATLLLLLLLAQLLRSQANAAKPLPVLGQVADFTLTNQDGRTVSLADLRGHVWVTDIIFTRCTGPCLRMTGLMRQLQEALPPGNQAKFVTLTTDPEYDTPAVLKTRANQFNADPSRWLFLTGTKKQIAEVAVNSLKLTAVPKEPDKQETPADLFIHSTQFVVVDKQAQMRGFFDTAGEGVDPTKTKSDILNAVRRLEKER
ncbi:MAG: cytochrome c oxidase assembly protein [Verrucomicrobia bacterium]|nr:MAG: cytochrome c oxidase assembly protein [Verrucomicrobiota bacterium]